MAKFFALLPVRDEGDIIRECLKHLLQWADRIFVFDTGSIDDTWEIVREIAAVDRRVAVLGSDPVYFSDTLVRGWMFEQARREMQTGDWFLRVDADEVHHIAPPEFVRQRLRPHESLVYHQYYDFRLLSSEVAAWDSGMDTVRERSRAIEERRRWYIPSTYAEPRLCRYRSSMRWPPSASFPFNAGYIAHERLPIRHYPHRDPVQLARRCRLRAAMMTDPVNRANWDQPESHHWDAGDWHQFITDDQAPGLRYWQQGTELPEVRCRNHLAAPPIRFAQRLVHALLLPLLDWQRPGWPEGARPRKIPPDIQLRLQKELRPTLGAGG